MNAEYVAPTIRPPTEVSPYPYIRERLAIMDEEIAALRRRIIAMKPYGQLAEQYKGEEE